MNNKKQNNKKISVSNLIQHFQTSPEEAYQGLISSRVYINKSEEFWTEYYKLDIPSLLIAFPDSSDTFDRMATLELFSGLITLYNKYITQCEADLLTLNPKPDSVIKALFLTIELGQTHSPGGRFSRYSSGSLSSVKKILRKITPKLSAENSTEYSLELFNALHFLLQLETDLYLLEEFMDLYGWAGFDLVHHEDGNGYTLTIPGETKSQNLYLLDCLKTKFKRDDERKASDAQVSKEEHFKEIDKTYKTNEGPLMSLHSGVTILTQTPGTTSMEVDLSIFENITSPDPEKYNEAMTRLMSLVLTQHFHLNLRYALTNIYQPNDETDIHHLRVRIGQSTSVSLYELFCAVSCLVALSDSFRYLGEYPESGEIRSVKETIIRNLKKDFPEESQEQLIEWSDIIIVNQFPEIEKNKNPFPVLTKKAIIRHLYEIKELQQKSEVELGILIDFIADLDNGLPFNPVYKIGDDYLFSYKACHVADLNRMMYDYVITKKLYSTKDLKKREAKQNETYHALREKNVNCSIKESLSLMTNYVEYGVEFPKKGEAFHIAGLYGETDVIAYFLEENILMPIQLKLSNTSKPTEKSKADWVNYNIEKAIDQVRKDSILLSSPEGLNYIAKVLKIDDTSRLSKATIYPLIITDNFYVDHERYVYGDEGKPVICISHFELKCLIANSIIDPRQKKWESLQESKSAKSLISLIEENVFWDFLKDGSIKKSDSLSVVDKDLRITLSL